jgi:hypothetical protein
MNDIGGEWDTVQYSMDKSIGTPLAFVEFLWGGERGTQ